MNDLHEQIVERLSDYIDGELHPQERSDIDRHLAACQDCRAILAELREVKSEAGNLTNTPPREDLWDGVAARLDAGGPAQTGRLLRLDARAPRRFSFTLPQLAAAGVAIMMMSGGMVWLAQRGNAGADFPAISADSRPGPAATGVEPASLGDAHYEGAVEDLERTLDQGRDRLDPETVRVLEQNLEAIDKAIDQSRRALDADPANTYLNNHLAAARQRKLALLRRATALTAGS